MKPRFYIVLLCMSPPCHFYSIPYLQNQLALGVFQILKALFWEELSKYTPSAFHAKFMALTLSSTFLYVGKYHPSFTFITILISSLIQPWHECNWVNQCLFLISCCGIHEIDNKLLFGSGITFVKNINLWIFGSMFGKHWRWRNFGNLFSFFHNN